MCAATYIVQSITNFVPNIKKLVNYCLFLRSVYEQKNRSYTLARALPIFLLMHRDFAADIVT